MTRSKLYRAIFLYISHNLHKTLWLGTVLLFKFAREFVKTYYFADSRICVLQNIEKKKVDKITQVRRKQMNIFKKYTIFNNRN